MLRVDGRLHRFTHALGALAELLPLNPTAANQFATTGSVDLGNEIPGVGRVRIHLFRADRGAAAAIRLLPIAAPALPLDEAGKYVAGAYLVFLALLLIYVAIMSVRLSRVDRELAELAELAERRKTTEEPREQVPIG